MQYKLERIPLPIAEIGTGVGPIAASSGSPFDIQIQPGPNLAANTAALAAFNRAAAQWKNYLTDPVTVVISAELTPDPNLALLGGASSFIFTYPLYGTKPSELGLISLLQLDNQGGAYQPLTDALPPTEAQFSVRMNPANSIITGPPPFGVNGEATKANFKALGFDPAFLDLITPGANAGEKARDAVIDFNSNQPFDYDRSNGVTPGTIDFESVAAHEIGHALGFLSDLDFMDFTNNAFDEPYIGAPTTLDLFRFEEGTAFDPQTLSEFTSFPRSYATGVAANTDLIIAGPGGAPEKRMSTGVFDPGGDGRQLGHWRDDALSFFNIGIMDPTLPKGQSLDIGPSDVAALDVIGWNIAVPEVATVLPVGLAVAGGILWQVRRRRTAPTLIS